MDGGKIKVLLAKLGLDVHNRGVLTVAKGLSSAGMEVVYIGNALPPEILEVALQEGVDVVGVSCLSGAHLTLGSSLMDLAREKGLVGEMVFLIGGVFPPQDVERLKDMGFDAVFLPGSTIEEIVETIHSLVKGKGAASREHWQREEV